MPQILYGKESGQSVIDHVYRRTASLRSIIDPAITPTLAVVSMANSADEAESYMRSIRYGADRAGVSIVHVTVSNSASLEIFTDQIETLNTNPGIHGIILLKPVRPTFMAAFSKIINPLKDVDGVSINSKAKTYTSGNIDGFYPPTADACFVILQKHGIKVVGKHIVVVGRSTTVGRAAALIALGKNATVTICHSMTEHLEEHLRAADIIISAVGKMDFITKEVLEGCKPNVVIIDTGVNFDQSGKMHGDVSDSLRQSDMIGAITPVIGGVGVVTTAVLIHNTMEACLSLSSRFKMRECQLLENA